MKLIFTLFFVIYFSANLSAQPQKAQIEKSFINKNAEYYLFNSQEAQDTFHVYIKIPESYNTAKTNFPVLYILDGDIVFPIVSGMMSIFYTANTFPR